MNPLFLVIIGIPAIEIFIMIKVGGIIGAFNTVSLIFLTAIVGIYFAKLQGIQTLRTGIVNIYQNKTPVNELITGASIAFAAMLLILPGFMTDIVGFFILLPFTRKLLIKLFLSNKRFSNQKNDKQTLEAEIIEDKDKKDEL